MSEESCEKKSCSAKKKVGRLAIGVIFIILGVSAVIGWWPDLIQVLKGCIGLFFIALGAIAILMAKG